MTCPQCGMDFIPKRKEQKYCSCNCSYIAFRLEKRGWFYDKRINPNYLVGATKYQFDYIKNYENKR